MMVTVTNKVEKNKVSSEQFPTICLFRLRVAMKHTQIINVAQLLFAPLPAYLLSRYLLGGGQISTPSGFFFFSSSGVKDATTISASSLSPFALANLLLAFSLLLGWLASLLQESTWLIDPYWTLVPPLLDALYAKACPGRSSSGGSGSGSGRSLLSSSFSTDNPRAAAATLLLLLWSLRLTHSYFRRERWRLGAREDWRYAEMRRAWGGNWWWWQLVPVYLVQHFLLVGLALPSFALRCCSASGKSSSSSAWGCLSSCAPPPSSPPPSPQPAPWHPLFDSLAVAAALSGLLLARAADSQLHAFVSAREEGRRRGERAAVLESGLWALSRHPNYLGETVFHVSLASLAVSGRYSSSASRRSSSPLPLSPPPLSVLLWPLAGAALNTACLVAVTGMTEARTAAARGRRRAWEAYCSRVPCWIPGAGPVVRKLTSGTAAAAPRARRKR